MCMKPYTYIIGWSKHNKFYYGARWSKDCDPTDLWKTYFTSSKHVEKFRKQCGEPDIVQVRKIFTDADKCRLYEQKTLRRLNVLREDKWLNKNINGRFLPFGPQSEEHKLARSRALKGHAKTFTKGKHSKESLEKMRLAQLGRPKSEEHKLAMRSRPQDTTTLTCPHCSESGDYKNMKRWHMDRCKHNPERKNDLEKMVTCEHCGHIAKQSPNFYRNHNKHCKSKV